jgi:hypothetical protein
VSRGRSNACNPLAPRIDKNLGNPVVKKVQVRTLADRRWICLLSVNIDAWLHLRTCPNAGKRRYVRMAPPRPVEISPRPAETNTSHTGSTLWKNLVGVCALLQGFGGCTRGCASAPPWNSTTPVEKKVPLGSTSLCGFLRIPLQRLGGYCWGQP